MEFRRFNRPGRKEDEDGSKNVADSGAGHLRIEKECCLGSNQHSHNIDLGSSGSDDNAGEVAERCSVVGGTLDCREFRCAKELYTFRLATVSSWDIWFAPSSWDGGWTLQTRFTTC